MLTEYATVLPLVKCIVTDASFLVGYQREHVWTQYLFELEPRLIEETIQLFTQIFCSSASSDLVTASRKMYLLIYTHLSKCGLFG